MDKVSMSYLFFFSRYQIQCITKGTVKWQTKWKWPNFSSLTKFEFINYYKVTISPKEHVQIFPLSSPSKTCTISFNFALERDLKNIYYQHDRLYEPGPQFFVQNLEI